MNNLPDVICIGTMKSGTTVLAHNLNRHPDVRLVKNPNDPKIASTELRFWNNMSLYNTFEKYGISWYKKLFKCNDKLQFEKCANYIEQKSTMKRIAKYIPNVKLVLCIRNPSNRAYSEFKMQKPNRVLTYETAVKKGYLRRGEYHKQIINNILPFFPKENLHIIIQERMKQNTTEEMNKLYKFIGVPELDYDIQIVTFEEATNRNLDLKKDGKIKKYKVWETKYKPINPELKEQFDEYFESHNQKLFELLGEEIKEWRS